MIVFFWAKVEIIGSDKYVSISILDSQVWALLGLGPQCKHTSFGFSGISLLPFSAAVLAFLFLSCYIPPGGLTMLAWRAVNLGSIPGRGDT